MIFEPQQLAVALAWRSPAQTGWTIGYGELLLMLAAIVVTFVALRSTGRKLKQVRRANQPPYRNVTATTREVPFEVARRRAIQDDVNEAILRLDELARHVNGQLDTRFAKLECIIRDADRRIDELSRLQRSAAGKPTVDTTIGDVSESDEVAPDNEHDDEELASIDSQSADDRHARVHDLADSGLSVASIAESLGRPMGEIELILALRETKSRCDNAPADTLTAPTSTVHDS